MPEPGSTGKSLKVFERAVWGGGVEHLCQESKEALLSYLPEEAGCVSQKTLGDYLAMG